MPDALPHWAAWPILAASLLVAYITLWRKGVVPLYRFVRRFLTAVIDIAASVPVLAEIAREFRPDHGRSLRDVVDHMHDEICGTRSDLAEHVATTQEITVAVKENLARIEIEVRNIQQGQVS